MFSPTISHDRRKNVHQTSLTRHAVRDAQCVEPHSGHSLRFYVIALAMVIGVGGMWYDAAVDWQIGPTAIPGEQVVQPRGVGAAQNGYADRYFRDEVFADLTRKAS
jgi:hypothetical protein